MSGTDGGQGRAGGRSTLEAFVRAEGAQAQWDWHVAEPARPVGSGALHTLRLVSQTWRGQPWVHRLLCFVPAAAPAPGPGGCLLYITGSGEHTTELALLQVLAARLGAPVAVLADVPNQPLFGGLSEDALIAHTFERFLDEGDASWPLLLPMTRAAVRAMDALQAFLPGQGLGRPEGFAVAGASKRGWTTYLTAAVDPRVRGIAPMVYDNLDLRAQLRRQREVFDGGYSPQIADYTERGLPARLDAPEGEALLEIVDPFAHRARLTMPKWLILGTNDPYWPVDAQSLYRDALPGDTFATYIPNAGHGLGEPERIAGALSGLWALAFPGPAAAGPVPLQARWQRQDGRVRVEVTGPRAAVRARLWTSAQPTLDFRSARWSAVRELDGGPPWSSAVQVPEAGHLAAFAELEVAGAAGSVALDSPIRVFGPGDA